MSRSYQASLHLERLHLNSLNCFIQEFFLFILRRLLCCWLEEKKKKRLSLSSAYDLIQTGSPWFRTQCKWHCSMTSWELSNSYVIFKGNLPCKNLSTGKRLVTDSLWAPLSLRVQRARSVLPFFSSICRSKIQSEYLATKSFVRTQRHHCTEASLLLKARPGALRSQQVTTYQQPAIWATQLCWGQVPDKQSKG